jgi:membrane protein
MPLKAVFMDIDGTLVDSNEFHVAAWSEAFHERGYQTADEEIRNQIGKGADHLIPALLPDLGEPKRTAIAERHCEIFRTRYLELVKSLPHATDLIEMIHASGARVILASSADKAEVEYYIDLLKISAMISGTVTNDDVANSKPAGDIFAAALAQVFPVAASETLAIGDTPYDVESALRSDIRTVGVLSGGCSTDALAAAGAAYIYASVKELFDTFDSSPLRA